MKIKILLTSYGRFTSHNKNPTWNLVESIEPPSSDFIIHTVHLPVRYGTCLSTLRAAIESFQPDAVFSFGFDGSHETLVQEQVGYNYAGTFFDMDGVAPYQLIYPGNDERVAEFTSDLRRLPAWNDRTKVGGWQIGSYYPTPYLCNYLTYSVARLCRLLPDTYGNMPFFFHHIPAISDDPATMDKAHQPLWAMQRLIYEMMIETAVAIGVSRPTTSLDALVEPSFRLRGDIPKARLNGSNTAYFPVGYISPDPEGEHTREVDVRREDGTVPGTVLLGSTSSTSTQLPGVFEATAQYTGSDIGWEATYWHSKLTYPGGEDHSYARVAPKGLFMEAVPINEHEYRLGCDPGYVAPPDAPTYPGIYPPSPNLGPPNPITNGRVFGPAFP